jgi:hypothetical protein
MSAKKPQDQDADKMLGLALHQSLPRYQCHKVVGAERITRVRVVFGTPRVFLGNEGGANFRLSPEWYKRHRPKAGDYLVVYADGYLSVSPASAFEGGYRPLSTVVFEPEEAERRAIDHDATMTYLDNAYGALPKTESGATLSLVERIKLLAASRAPWRPSDGYEGLGDWAKGGITIKDETPAAGGRPGQKSLADGSSVEPFEAADGKPMVRVTRPVCATCNGTRDGAMTPDGPELCPDCKPSPTFTGTPTSPQDDGDVFAPDFDPWGMRFLWGFAGLLIGALITAACMAGGAA